MLQLPNFCEHGHKQQDRVEAHFRRIAKDGLRMNRREARTPNLVAVESAGLDFRRRDAHFGKGLSSGDGSCHQRQGSDHEFLEHGSDKHVSLNMELSLRFDGFESATGQADAEACLCCECQRNFCNASVVSFGRSSSTQCPVFFSTTTVASVATSLACCASASPNDLSPPMVSTGMVNLV
jgi:hypothetical protein